MANATRDGVGRDEFSTAETDAPLGQLISMTDWCLPDSGGAERRRIRPVPVRKRASLHPTTDREESLGRLRLERRRAEREARLVAQAARQLAGAIRCGDSDRIDWWQDALADLESA